MDVMQETVTPSKIKINFVTGWDGGIVSKIEAGCEIVKNQAYVGPSTVAGHNNSNEQGVVGW